MTPKPMARALDYLPWQTLRRQLHAPGAPGAASGFTLWYHTVVLAATIGIIFANLPVYVYVRDPGWLPKFFFFALSGLLAPLLLFRSKSLSAYLVSPFAIWASLLILLNLVHFGCFALDGNIGPVSASWQQHETRAALIMTRTQYVVFAWLLGFAAFASRRQSYQTMFAFLAVLLPCVVLLDFVRPGIFYTLDTSGAVAGRAAAMFINPTMAGEALLLAFLLSCASIDARYRVPLYLLLGAGVLVTFSRSSMIGWLLLGPMLIMWRVLPRYMIGVVFGMLCLFLLSSGMFESYLSQRHDLGDALSNLQARLDFFSSADLNDDSARERAAVIQAGIDLFLQNPIFGAGAGATQFWSAPVSTHNQLLMLAAEYGVFGIVLWFWLVILLWRGQFFQDRRLQCAVTVLFVFMSMFTHQMFDSASYWLATFALVSIRRKQSAAIFVTRRLA